VGDQRLRRAGDVVIKFWRDGDPIIQVEIDAHRWYSVVTVTYESNEKVVKVIGTQQGDGLGTYDSVEEWELINT
jgi:hypothetical protein